MPKGYFIQKMSLAVGKSGFNSALAIVYNAPYLYNRFVYTTGLAILDVNC